MTWLPGPGLLWILPLYGALLALHLGLPARRVSGYVRDPAGVPLRYRLNGILVLLSSVGLWAAACQLRLLAWDALYVHRWELAEGACMLGAAFTLWVVLTAPRGPGRSLLQELYLGRTANPQWWGGRVDAKMALYLLGAVMLELNLLSFAAHQVMHFPRHQSWGVIVYTALFTFFLLDYLTFEKVHLYTYDFVAENVGFKLGWGCLVFYPFFYPVGLWAVADREVPGLPFAWELGAVGLFFCGWVLSRGANLQKFWFKVDPGRSVFGLMRPEALTGRDGKTVLVSGFWGLSRHINYLGELLMATGLTLSLGVLGAWAPWLYPLYYLALLVPRQREDDRRCQAKYGDLWEEYRRRVPHRIVPFLY